MVNWILLILAVVLGLYIYQKNNNKPWKLLLGGLLIIVGILIISPIPDPSDAIGFAAFSMVKGIDLNMDNFSTYFLEYLLLTFVLGITMAYTGMRLLGWNFKRLWKKLNLDKFGIALGIGFLVILIIAYLDIKGLILFTDLGRDYTSGDFPHSYWIAFRNTAYILMGLVSLCYWFFVRKDKSETLAVFLFPFIMFWFGLSDIFYFILRKVPIPETLNWLDNHIIIGNVSRLLGFNGVTNFSLLVTASIGIVIALIVAKLLRKYF